MKMDMQYAFKYNKITITARCINKTYKICRCLSTRNKNSQLKKFIILSLYVQKSIVIYAHYTLKKKLTLDTTRVSKV